MDSSEFLKRPLTLVLAMFGILSLIAYLAIPEDASYFSEITYFFYLGAVTLGVMVLFVVVKFYGLESFEGKVWFLIALGLTLTAIGEYIWFYYEMIAGVDPFPSIGDVAYIASYFPITLAFIYKARFTKTGIDLKKSAAVVLIVALIAIPTYLYVASPILADQGVLDVNGGPMDDAPYLSFTTVAVGGAPAWYTVDDDGYEDVALNATIVMTLDPATDHASAEENFWIWDENGEEPEGELALVGNTLIFTPDSPLEPETFYEAEIYVGYGSVEKAVCLIYPILDLMLLAFALHIALYWGSSVSRGWYLVAIAIMFTTLADISFAAMDWHGLYSYYMDLLWISYFIWLALGGLYQMELHKSFM